MLSCAFNIAMAGPMSETTMLDVSQYARLWRGLWWAQRVAMPLALAIGGILVASAGFYVAGRLDALANALITEITGYGSVDDALKDPTKHEALTNVAACYLMVRGTIEHAPVSTAMVATACIVLIGAYLFGFGTFRLRPVMVSLLALAIVAIVSGSGLVKLVGAGALTEGYKSDGGPVQTLADTAAAVICFVVLALSLLLLMAQGVFALLLWRHRLRHDLLPTRQMTQSYGINLAFPQIRIRAVSPLGISIHLGVLVALGVLLWWFSDWVGYTLAFSPIYLLLLLVWLLFLPLLMVHRALTGETLARYADVADIITYGTQSARLVVLAAVLVAARSIWRLGTRFNLRRRDQIILTDKPPVLLLRSFVDDVAGIPPNALFPRLFWRPKRLEETIGEELTRAGPFVAIGKPGERLPQIGAHRRYVADSQWQELVKSYIACSQSIILIAGKTMWVQWELANIVAQRRVGQLLIVFPRITDIDRAERWENLKPVFGGTEWSAAAETVDIAGALAIFTRDQSFVVIRTRRAHESDYELALKVAAHSMDRTVGQLAVNVIS